MTERARLKALLEALDASPRALCRDRCGDWIIRGKAGHIFANRSSFLLYVMTDESARRWAGIKRRLGFCLVTQDGDDEGCLRLDRLPTAAEAEAIREAIGIRKRRHMTAEALVQLEAARNTANWHFERARIRQSRLTVLRQSNTSIIPRIRRLAQMPQAAWAWDYSQYRASRSKEQVGAQGRR